MTRRTDKPLYSDPEYGGKPSWNQPQCERCWVVEHSTWEGDQLLDVRLPVRMELGSGPPERCAWCGLPTWVGIWVRADPSTVPYPSQGDP